MFILPAGWVLGACVLDGEKLFCNFGYVWVRVKFHKEGFLDRWDQDSKIVYNIFFKNSLTGNVNLIGVINQENNIY